MQRVFASSVLALTAILLILCLAGCGGTATVNTKVTSIVLNPTSISLNEGGVATLSAVAKNSNGATVPADITFTSSNTAIATVSSGGVICAGVWDANIINCNATIGQGGVGQVTITATSGSVTANAAVYVHLQVDEVDAVLANSCTTLGQPVAISGQAFSTTAPGCSPTAKCDITSTVGPFTFGSNDNQVAATSAGIEPTFNSSTNTPVYVSGGTITGTNGQTCNLTSFNTVINAAGTVALTGTNVIAAGTHLTITDSGFGANVAPTTAALSNGTATCSGTANVQTALNNGVLTAEEPGATTVFASVSGVNSVGTQYETCRVVSVKIHDTNSDATTFTLNPLATQALTADVVDAGGQTIKPALSWGTSLAAAASISGISNAATVTGVAGGTAYVTATCIYPTCNRNVPPEFTQNLATFNVTQPSATKVYATNTTTGQLVPIDTSTNTAGTPINLPTATNSIVADSAGKNLYLGSTTVLIGVNVSTGALTFYSAPGIVRAISADSNYVLVSNPDNGTIYYVNIATAAVASTTPGTTVSSAFTPDSKFNEWINGTELAFGRQTGFTGSVILPNPANAMDISAHGALTYITTTGVMNPRIFAYSTCNQTQAQGFSADTPTLVKALPNGTGAVAVDSPNLDVITTPAVLDPGCPLITQSSPTASYDLQAGNFTAQQLMVTSDAKRVWIVSNLPRLLSFDLTALTPSSVPLTGGATAFNGGVTMDGSRVYVGTSDGTVHQIDTASMTDAAQIQVNLKDPNGNAVVPNLVAVVP